MAVKPPVKPIVKPPVKPITTQAKPPIKPVIPVKPAGFNQQQYAKGMTDQVNAMYNAQKQAQLQQFYNQRDKAVGQINQQKAELEPMYAGKRNQADVVSNQNMMALKEQMAAQGLQSSGENVTATVGANNARLGALAELNMQQQQQTNDLDRRIADINDPGEEMAITNAIEAQRMQALYDAGIRADEVGYQRGRDLIGDQRYADETKYNRGRDTISDKRYADETKYSRGRDKVGDNQWNQQFQYGKSQDKLAEAWRQKEWSQMSPAEKQREALNLANSLKLKGSSGGGGGSRGRSSSSKSSKGSGLTQKGPQKLDIDPNKLKAILDTMGKITPTYGTQGYYDKMKNLQY